MFMEKGRMAHYDSNMLVHTLNVLPGSFSKTLVELMKTYEITAERLAEKSNISLETISRLRRCKECNSSFETLISICIGLNLHPLLSLDLLRKAGKTFQVTKKHVIYYDLLHVYWQKTIEDANDYLIQNGIKPLKGTN